MGRYQAYITRYQVNIGRYQVNISQCQVDISRYQVDIGPYQVHIAILARSMVVDNIRYSHCNVLNFSCEKQIALNMIFLAKATTTKKSLKNFCPKIL